MDDNEALTIPNNMAFGRNISRLWKYKEKKASVFGKSFGIGHPAYTKYERCESKIVIDLDFKGSEF